MPQTTENAHGTISVTMFLRPIFYANSALFDEAELKETDRERLAALKPASVVFGPALWSGEDLENPISEEWEGFINDCLFFVKTTGFTLFLKGSSVDPDKARCVMDFCLNGVTCGSVDLEMKISKRALRADFPNEAKEKASEYLKVDKVLSGDAFRAGIDFRIERVLVGRGRRPECESWNRALQRIYSGLKRTRYI